jgi:hypothetical protein
MDSSWQIFFTKRTLRQRDPRQRGQGAREWDGKRISAGDYKSGNRFKPSSESAFPTEHFHDQLRKKLT